MLLMADFIIVLVLIFCPVAIVIGLDEEE